MKKIGLLLVCCVLSLSIMAQGKKGGNSTRHDLQGFRDIKWGEHIDSVYSPSKVKLNFLKSDQSKDMAYYLENDDMSIGTVNLSSILYYFTDRGKFTKVVMRADKKYFMDMRFILTYKFEEPQGQRMMNGNNIYSWNIDDVRITLSDGSADGQMVVEFSVDYNMMEFRSINRNVSDF